MAKKTSNSQQSPSSSSSATKASTGLLAEELGDRKEKEEIEELGREMVLKVQQSEGTRRSTRLSSVNAEGKRIVSVKKSKTKQKKKSAKVDSKIPKKPPTAFFYFLEDYRKELQEQNPGIKQMREIGKVCGEKWKTMTYEEKVQYYDTATEKRAEFEKAMAEYAQRKESGEDEETEDEEEEDWSV